MKILFRILLPIFVLASLPGCLFSPSQPPSPSQETSPQKPNEDKDIKILNLSSNESKNNKKSSTNQQSSYTFHPVSHFQFQYLQSHPDHPPLKLLENVQVKLVRRNNQILAPEQTDQNGQPISISTFQNQENVFQLTPQAIQTVIKQILEDYNERGYVGVYVIPHPRDMSMKGKDRRDMGTTRLRINIYTSTVTSIQTLAQGARFGEGQNLEEHEWIRDQSPLQPADDPSKSNPILNKDLLDRYTSRISRHPGRQVRLGIARAEEGTARLNYFVQESKPWNTSLQISNTGSENTGEIQQQFNFTHNQLTGHDDILRFSYLTAGGDDLHTLNMSYERPLSMGSPTRLKVEAGNSRFSSMDIGIPGAGFRGETWNAGAQISTNIYQNGDFFLDLKGGIDWKQIFMFDKLLNSTGREDILKPYIGLSFEHSSRKQNTRGQIRLEHNLPELITTELTDTDELQKLGRSNVDREWTRLNFNASHSFYLEPLLYGDDWNNPETPETSTLAHEIRLSTRGQWAFERRLISQSQFVVGGMRTVRGYPPSIASGDSGIMGQLEYRLHVPRLLPIDKDPPEILGSPFRLAPNRVFGYPDWDLVLTGFFDYANTLNHQRLRGSEFNRQLTSTGIGAELTLDRYAQVQWFWGYVLDDLAGTNVRTGDQEVHLALTLFY